MITNFDELVYLFLYIAIIILYVCKYCMGEVNLQNLWLLKSLIRPRREKNIFGVSVQVMLLPASSAT